MASGESVRITGLPDSPTSIAWSPDGRQIAYTMFVPGEGMRLGAPPAKPGRRDMGASRSRSITAVTYRTDGEGYLKPGFSHIFLVSADGGAPRQLSFGSVHDNGPLSWSPDGRSILFSSNRSPRLGARAAQQRSLRARHRQRRRSARSPTATGPDGEPVVSPDGRLIAYTGFDDKRLGYQNTVLYVMDRDGGEPPRC